MVDWRQEVDPEIAPLIRSVGPVIGDLALEDLPALYEERRATPEVRGRPDVLRSDVSSSEAGIGLRVHRPAHQSGVAPCVYSIHGGSFIAGSNRMDDAVLAQWSARFGCVAVSVDYRLAPEHPYPTALQDCQAGLFWLLENARDLGIDAGRVGLRGVSAGAALAAGLALLMRDRQSAPLAFQVLEFPALDDRQQTVSATWDVPIAGYSTIRLGWRAYLGGLYGTEDVPPYAAPARATTLKGLPATFVAAGRVDVLHDEAVEFAQRLEHDGVATELRIYEGGVHNFAALAPASALAGRFRSDQEVWLTPRLTRA